MTTPFDCPRCGVVLSLAERQGVEIDYCPQCRGVWLDRGELDKIIARAEPAATPGADPSSASPHGVPPPTAWSPGGAAPARYDQGHDPRGEHGWGSHRDHGRRKSWLREIFD